MSIGDFFQRNFGWFIGLIVMCGSAFFICEIVSLSWLSSERASAYRAYTECLHEMRGQPIDVVQSFCGKIRDQL